MVKLLLGWALWCTLHSLLITPTAQQRICGDHPRLQAGYRLGYICFALISLLPLLWYQQQLPQRQIFSFSGLWRLPQVLLLSYGLWMFVAGARAYDLAFFLGLRQWRAHRQGEPLERRFQENGILGSIRHPWYSGGIALLWGMEPVTDLTLPVRLLLSGYLLVGTLLEERRLKQELGTPYRDYCRRVPMLFPWKGILPKKRRGRETPPED
ncbi:methyltransferase family protein [Desulfogranum mediterraneum]|uniref:methyltransferase family protein n=1 Tax=Desulfogranum mediterraneum TaxID=160661 RepID=UPI00040E12E7|nr:NnrU family protein [Desulfogranum mediterraneum]